MSNKPLKVQNNCIPAIDNNCDPLNSEVFSLSTVPSSLQQKVQLNIVIVDLQYDKRNLIAVIYKALHCARRTS